MQDRSGLRRRAEEIFGKGLARADPFAPVVDALKEHPVDGLRLIIAVGKAGRRMAEAALSIHPGVPTIVVTNDSHAEALEGARVLAAGHPDPDERGLAAAKTIVSELARLKLTAADAVLVLISGGGSALLPAPVEGVSLADKVQATKAVSDAGADIVELNTVRQQLSTLKGGGLLRFTAPAKVCALILSDVVGDDVRVIASGPTASPIGTRSDARRILQARGVWMTVAPSVRDHLEKPDDTSSPPPADNRLIATNRDSVRAMKAFVPDAQVHDSPLVGDVSDAARLIVATAGGPGIYLFGGETTVKVTNKNGQGGRNQDLALRVALAAREAGWTKPWVFLSAGTDGLDGRSQAAGGLVDDQTLQMLAAKGIDPVLHLAQNNSFVALSEIHQTIDQRATGTNVADLQVLIRT